MRHKSILNLAIALIQALFLTTSVDASASTEADLEIGVPKPVESKVNGCFDVHLSPKSDRFYTLRDGLLTQYQINPLKKLGAIPGDWDVIKEPGCYMRITDDEKKLLVIDKNRIYAFDMGTGRLLHKAEWEHRAYPAAIINNDDLLILQRNSTGDHQSVTGRVWVEFYIWDIATLKLKQKITGFGENFGFIQDTGGWPAMTKIQDRIYLKSDRSIVVLNSKTYEPELSLNTVNSSLGGKLNRKPLVSSELPLLSKDFRTLYVPNVKKMTDYLTGKQASFDEIGRDKAFVFDQTTREFRIDSLENLSRSAFDPKLFSPPTHSSRNKNYLMSGQGSAHAQAAFIDIARLALAFFYQYEGGEAIVVEYRDNRPTAFQLTPDARKYLMMDKDGRIPINDATFAKYYRPLAQDK